MMMTREASATNGPPPETPAQRMVRWVFWCAIAAVLVLTLVPGHYLPQKGPFNFWDKAQHALAFGGLTTLGLWVWRTGPQRARLLIGLVALGGAIEVAQHLTGWRRGEWADWAADAVGVVVVAMLVWRFHRPAVVGRA